MHGNQQRTLAPGSWAAWAPVGTFGEWAVGLTLAIAKARNSKKGRSLPISPRPRATPMCMRPKTKWLAALRLAPGWAWRRANRENRPRKGFASAAPKSLELRARLFGIRPRRALTDTHSQHTRIGHAKVPMYVHMCTCVELRHPERNPSTPIKTATVVVDFSAVRAARTLVLHPPQQQPQQQQAQPRRPPCASGCAAAVTTANATRPRFTEPC